VTAFAETPERFARRGPLQALEAAVVRIHQTHPDPDAQPVVDSLRYLLSFCRLTQVRAADGADVYLDDLVAPLATHVVRVLSEPLKGAETLWVATRELPELLRRVRAVRALALERIDRASLEAEVTTRVLAVASGGGGGAGYNYPGCYEVLERASLTPDLMAGTSIGSLMAMFRCRRRRWDMAPLVAAARQLSWTGIFKVLQTENRYGLPATLRLHLQGALGGLFRNEDDRALLLGDLEIPLYIVATGITMDALKHDLGYYEHLLDNDVRRRGVRGGLRAGLKAIGMLREFLSRRDALVELVLGRDPGTDAFNVLDAAGFSAAIPAVIHYDVLRDDPDMKALLDRIYAEHGITRLGEGGMVSNVPARICWETIIDGRLGRRNAFVLALDCFAPDRRRLAWYPFQQAVQVANVDADRVYADLYVPLGRTLSPMNLVPPIRDALTAIRWGREDMAPHMPFISEMMRPLPVLAD
jgi:predicted acylesterase/phospholipase RssA